MPLAIPQIILGTQVALTHDEEGERLPVERRGVIVAVDTARKIGKDEKGKTVILSTTRNGNPATGVDKIWVRFRKGDPPVAVKNIQLTLIHEANRKAFDEIKREEAVKKAAEIEAKAREGAKLEQLPEPNEGDIPIVIPDEPVVVNEVTPEDEGHGLTADQIRALEAGEEPLRDEKGGPLTRVMPK